MKGLIIKGLYAFMVIEGTKTWELRGSRTHIRGTIGIIESGTGAIQGTVDIVDCIELPREDIKYFHDSWDKHRVIYMEDIKYKKIYAWVLKNAIRYPEPIPYKHPQGAVIWVNL